MQKTDRKIELLGKLQEELDRRTQVEEEAVRLISNGECEKACELLSTLDDRIVKSIRQELDQLDADAAKGNKEKYKKGFWDRVEYLAKLFWEGKWSERIDNLCLAIFWPVLILWCIAALVRIILCFL